MLPLKSGSKETFLSVYNRKGRTEKPHILNLRLVCEPPPPPHRYNPPDGNRTPRN